MKLVLIALAVAHSWYTGYHDPVTGYECCDDKKDCGVISPRFVEPLPGGGFNVRTGSGPKDRYFIPKNRVIESEDSQYHICLSPPFSYIRCFFAPHTQASRAPLSGSPARAPWTPDDTTTFAVERSQ